MTKIRVFGLIMVLALVCMLFPAVSVQAKKTAKGTKTVSGTEREISSDSETEAADGTERESAPETEEPGESGQGEETEPAGENETDPGSESGTESEPKEADPGKNKPEETESSGETQKTFLTMELPDENTAETAVEPKRLICIDPGHQAKGNSAKEPVGPGSKVMKKKCSSGTEGKWSKLTEAILNLDVSLQLRDELEKRGYEVVMTRTVQEVNISNIERAEIANRSGADLMIRIHANSHKKASTRGAFTICCTKKNKFYAGKYYKQSRRLADQVIRYFVKATGSKYKKVWETDTMTGINWSKVPVIILEMGHMSNKTEDLMMAKKTYQAKMVQGIANGIDAYFLEESGK